MLKHRGFPGRLPSTDLQFVIRRASPKGATRLVARERFRDRAALDRRADTAFLAALIEHFGDEPFERGNLDAGRLGWLLNREVLPVGAFDPESYDQLLRVDLARAARSFPELFEDAAQGGAPDDLDSEGDDPDNDDDAEAWDDDAPAPPGRRRRR